jgi:predicted small lipoprotein YifL
MKQMMKILGLILITITILAGGLTACGKKGPPIPPDADDDGKQQESPSPDNDESRRGTPY